MYLVINSKFCFAIGFTKISILKLFKTVQDSLIGSQLLHKMRFVLSYVEEMSKMSKCTVKTIFWLKTDLISFFIYDLCYRV